MGRIDQETFVCIDCEMTGLDPQEDRIIEVGLMKFRLNEILDQFESLVNPERTIPEASIEYHHITDDMVVGKPTMTQIIPHLIDKIGNYIVVGHGVGFDIELIALAADRAGIPHRLRSLRILDTLRMARLYGECPVNSLEQLRKHFNIPFEGAHRALNDVIVNKEVFRFLAMKYKTTEQLFEALSRPILMKVMPLGKYKGRPIKEIPIDYLKYVAHKEFDQDLLYSIRSEIKRRKKGPVFGEAGNPFSTL